MKIKFSLRIYFFSAMTVLGLGLGVLFFSLATNYLSAGVDTSIRASMLFIANKFDPEDGLQLFGFTLTTQWQDLPSHIRDNIGSPPTEPSILAKHVVRTSMFKNPSRAYYAILVEDKFGNREYVSRFVDPEFFKHYSKTFGSRFIGIVALGIGISAAFMFIMILMIRSINEPVESLNQWTKKLKKENLNEPPPDFRYPELNNFAEVIRSSLLTAQESIEREHSFLRHASHELRTPIAVIGNSTELLQRLNDSTSPKEIEVISRIERASLTMKSLTEALLWLSREEEEPLPANPVQLNELVEQLQQDLSYLLKGKEDVQVICETTPETVNLPLEASRIILSNLIRNAFQHTQTGEISIKQTNSTVTISNPSVSEDNVTQDELGFGLGLQLCRQLAERFNWPLKIESTQGCHIVYVEFK